MTPYRYSSIVSPSVFTASKRWAGVVFGVCALAAGSASVSSCGAQSNNSLGSTNTGNPPVISEQRLRVRASGDGVIVSGGSGAVTANAEVTVTNLSTGDSQETTAGSDGSFEVSLSGTVSDEYRVEATLGGQRTSVTLNAVATSPSVNPDAAVTSPTVDSDAAAGLNLEGLTFLLESIEGYTLVDDSTVQLSFLEDERMRFVGGCNNHTGIYSVCDGRLCVSGFGSTKIACSEELSAQEAWLADFFVGTPSVSYEPPRLTFEGEGAILEFLESEVADPDRPLTGRVWSVDTFISGDTASNVPLESVPTVQFGEDGNFEVFDTCNTLAGSYSVNEEELTVTDVTTTDVACTDPSSQLAQNHIGQVFTEGTVGFAIEADRLTLMRGELGLSATTD